MTSSGTRDARDDGAMGELVQKLDSLDDFFDDDDFDVVVIGSGFGGSVAAYELASRGARVCVLERGKDFPPGSFARTPSEMAHNLWDPSEGLHGMFNVWSFKGIDALTASGLGGGSLIYANVILRRPEAWFAD